MLGEKELRWEMLLLLIHECDYCNTMYISIVVLLYSPMYSTIHHCTVTLTNIQYHLPMYSSTHQYNIMVPLTNVQYHCYRPVCEQSLLKNYY